MSYIQAFVSFISSSLFPTNVSQQQAVDFLDALDVPFIKVASADANNFALIEHMASKGRPLVISSGMQSMENMQKVKCHKTYYCIYKNSKHLTPPQKKKNGACYAVIIL